MDLLTCVNNILPYLGEAPVTTIDKKHPTVSIILGAIEQAKKSLLIQGWWFNTRRIKLYPSSEGDMPSPTNALFLDGVDSSKRIEMRGRRIYDLTEGTYKFSKPIEVNLIEDLDFEELPYSAALWIQYRACAQAYTKDFGLEDILREISTRENEAFIILQSEHLRKMRYSTLKSRNAQKYFNALRG